MIFLSTFNSFKSYRANSKSIYSFNFKVLKDENK